MRPRTLGALAWVLIYSGLLMAGLGLALRDAQPALGLALIVAGVADTALGVGFIVWRARLGDDAVSPSKKERA